MADKNKFQHSGLPLKELYIPANRWVGFLKLALSIPWGALLVWIAMTTLSSLQFKSSVRAGWITDWGWAFVMFWVGLTGLILVSWGFRWLLYLCWLGRMGMSVNSTAISFSLGPFGKTTIPVNEISAIYRHELDSESMAKSTEDYLDEDEEIRSRLPILRHPHIKIPLNRWIDRYIDGTEQQHLELLRPMIERIRGKSSQFDFRTFQGHGW